MSTSMTTTQSLVAVWLAFCRLAARRSMLCSTCRMQVRPSVRSLVAALVSGLGGPCFIWVPGQAWRAMPARFTVRL